MRHSFFFFDSLYNVLALHLFTPTDIFLIQLEGFLQ